MMTFGGKDVTVINKESQTWQVGCVLGTLLWNIS